MKGLHPVAAFLIILMVVAFLYMETQNNLHPERVPVESASKPRSLRPVSYGSAAELRGVRL